MNSQSLAIQRLVLGAGTKTPIFPPRMAQEVSIGNATADDVSVHSTDADNAHYVVVTAGYERPFPVKRTLFDPTVIAFWLTSVAGGTVVLIWY